MKKILLPLLVLLLAGQAGFAQTVVYDANAQVRKVGDFSGVHVSSAITLYVSQGAENSVAIGASKESDLAHVITEVKDGVLRIRIESAGWRKWGLGNSRITAYVTVHDLKSLEVSGASSAHINGDLHSPDLRLEISGASSLAGAVRSKTLRVELGGSSVATLTGAADALQIEASGSSVFKGNDLTVISCKAEASGASGISLNVTKELNAEASGASSIRYRGEAVIRHMDISGASSIRQKNG